MRELFATILGVWMSFGFSGCEVFVDFGLKNSTFELYRAEIPGSDFNVLGVLMPGYEPNNPDFRYEVNYFDGDKCTGEWFAADSLNYEVEGTWTLVEPDVMRIDLDQFVNGDFKITKLDQNTYLLESEANFHGFTFIENPTLPLRMYTRRIQ